MEIKPKMKKNVQEYGLYTLLVIVQGVVLSTYNPIAAIIFMCLLGVVLYRALRVNEARTYEWNEYIESLSIKMDETSKKTIESRPIPICVIKFNGKIFMYNELFSEIAGKRSLLNEDIDEIFEDIELDKDLNEGKEMYTDIVHNGRQYTVIYKVIKNGEDSSSDYMMILYMIDRTEYRKMRKQYLDNKNVIGIIEVDGYDEVLKSAREENRSLLTMDIERTLSELETTSKAALKRISGGRFFVVMTRKELKKLESEKFEILDRIRNINRGNSLPVTISFGIGVEGETVADNFKMATGALDLALGRGGDQVVVKTNDNFAFYGGKSKAIEKKTKVKSRLIGHALREIIMQSEHILIMGHRYPDMDAMGAAVGIYDICKSCDKKANIVLSSINEAIDIFGNKVRKNEYYKGIFINHSDAIELCKKDTLVVVLDTHRPSFTECPELLDISEKIVVIDHHRRGVEFISDTVLLFHEIYVSSTSEMVTELIQYMDQDIKINKLTADGLLAGICLDTKNFAFKTGVRTFEAASFLRRIGADTIEVKKLFNSDISDFIVKAEIIQNTKIINNRICIGYTTSEIDNVNIIIAKAADELLSIRDVDASFVLGQKEGKIFISARSLGDINVHVMMEKLGGGGHIDIAGAQLKNVSLQKAYKMVHEIIEKYLEEENQKEEK